MKKCNDCNIQKDEIDFNKKSKILQSYCRSCQSKRHSKYYKSHKRDYYEKNGRLNERNKEFIYNYLQSNPCVDCKETDPIVLDFDHLENKEFNISTMICSGYSLHTIQNEINKCVIRCANCHRRKTAKESNSFKYRKIQANSEKVSQNALNVQD